MTDPGHQAGHPGPEAKSAGTQAERLATFEAGLRALLGDDDRKRPFVCPGDPFTCRAFVIGFNPATAMAFWPYWNPSTGFDRARWQEEYEKCREGRKPSPTRQRIERLAKRASPVLVLETNLYPTPSPSARSLPAVAHDDRVLHFLLQDIKPQAVLLHGEKTAASFQKRYGVTPGTNAFARSQIEGREIHVAAVRHLSCVSYDLACRLGDQIWEICGTASTG